MFYSWFGDHMLMPPGKFFTMFHFLVSIFPPSLPPSISPPPIINSLIDQQEYPFSRGSTHIQSADPYESPDFDAGFMNDKRDMAPMVWGYIKSRETARRMGAYAGEVTGMHPHFSYDSPARAFDLDLETTKAYAGPNHISAGIQHGTSLFLSSLDL